jgi:hypothetical protein
MSRQTDKAMHDGEMLAKLECDRKLSSARSEGYAEGEAAGIIKGIERAILETEDWESAAYVKTELTELIKLLQLKSAHGGQDGKQS